MSAYTLLRVSVPTADQTGWTTVDVAPPNAGATVREVISNLVMFLRETFAQTGRDTAYLDVREAKWTLTCGTLGEPLDPDKTLEELKILDGSSLFLTHENARESFTRVLDDTSDAIAEQLKRSFPQWSQSHAMTTMMIAAPATAAAAAAAAMIITLTRPVTWPVSAALAALLCLAGVLAGVFAVPAVNTAKPWAPRRSSGAVAVAVSVMLLTTAGIVAVPGDLSAWHLLAAGSVALASSLTLRSLVVPGVEASVSAGAAFGTILVVAAVPAAFAGWDRVQMMVAVMCSAVVMLLYGSRLALASASIPLPYIPAAGETFVRDGRDLSSVPMSTDVAAVEELINMTTRITAARGIRLGIVAAGVAAVSLATLTLTAGVGPRKELVALFVATVIIGMIFHGMTEADAAVSMLWRLSSLALSLAVPVALAITGAADDLIGPAAAAAVVGFAVSLVLTLRQVTVTSPPLRRVMEIIEGAVFFAPLALAVFLLDLYGLVVSA